MQSLVRDTDLDTEDVLRALRGVSGKRSWKFRYELLTASGARVRDLTNVLGASVDNSLTAEIKRTAKFSIRDDGAINYLSQRIRPWAGIEVKPGVWMEWPLGVFLLTTPKRSIDISGALVREVEGYDQMMVLIDDVVPGRYYVGADVPYTSAVTEILSNTQGISSYSIPNSNIRTAAAIEWEPGTSKSAIISDLLAAINYESLWFDGEGTARSSPYIAPSAREASFKYETDLDSVILPEAEVDTDYYKIPNRWVLIVSNPDQPPLRAEIVNTSPYSPTSTVNRGRLITRVIDDVQAPNQNVLNSIAERYRDEDGQIFETVTFSSGLMPIHENGDVLDFAYFDLNVGGRYLEMGWSAELSQGSQMRHTLRRTVSVLSGFGIGPFGLMPFGG